MARPDFPDRFGTEYVAGIGDPRTGQPPDRFLRKFASEADQIRFFHMMRRRKDPVRKRAVVRDKHESRCVLIQPSGGEKPGAF